MHKLTTLLLLAILFALQLPAQEKEFKLDEVVVTAGRIPISFSNLGRSVIVLNAEEIKSLPVSNITGLLRYINSIDLKMRGFEGVQSDAGIRGGTFEQTLILVDGVKLSDPQTGHHNLNIPVSLENIERIEVLKGQGSRIFGANAFSGAVNIITKKSKKSLLSILAQGGEHNLYNLDVATFYPIFSIGNSISFSKKKSNGYTHNTNFDITQFSFNQNYTIAENNIALFFGYIDKKFGANNFYSDRFPNQWPDNLFPEFENSEPWRGQTNLSLSMTYCSISPWWVHFALTAINEASIVLAINTSLTTTKPPFSSKAEYLASFKSSVKSTFAGGFVPELVHPPKH